MDQIGDFGRTKNDILDNIFLLSLIINGDGGCGFWQPTGGLTARVVWPGLRVGGRLAPCHIHHMNRVNSRSGFSYDDSTINVVVGIIIIIIILTGPGVE